MAYPEEIRFEVEQLFAALHELREAQETLAEAVFAVEQAHEPLVIETTEVLSSEMLDLMVSMIPTDSQLDQVERAIRFIVREAAHDVAVGA